MSELVNVEVVVDSLQDLQIYNKVTTVERKGKKIELYNKLLFKGDKYQVDKKRAEYLEKKGLVKIIIEKKTPKVEDVTEELKEDKR